MECFVCASNEHPLYRVCRCQTLVHEHCFRRLLTLPTHRSHCAVCQTPYELTMTSKCECVLHRLFCTACSLVFLFFVSLSILFVQTFAYSFTNSPITQTALHVTMGAMTCIAGLLWLVILRAYYRQNRTLCDWVRIVKVPKLVSIGLPVNTSPDAL